MFTTRTTSHYCCGSREQTTRYSLSLEILALVTTITLLPSLLLMMTSFVRILIVMSLLRMAVQLKHPQIWFGRIGAVSNNFIMSPILSEVWDRNCSILDETLSFDEAIKRAEVRLEGLC